MASYLTKFKNTFIKPYIDGSKTLYKDIIEVRKIRSREDQQLSRREWRLIIHTKKNLAKAVPVLIFFFLPIVGYLVPILCYMFPFVLPPTFMTPDQKRNIWMKKDIRRLNGKVELTKSLSPLLQLPSNVFQSGKLTNGQVIDLLPAFRNHLENFETIPHKNIRQLGEFFCIGRLSAILGIVYPWYIERSITKSVSLIQTDDQYLQKEGVSLLSDEEVTEACLERGLEGFITTNKEKKQKKHSIDAVAARNSLKDWIELQNQIYQNTSLNKEGAVSIFAHALLFKIGMTLALALLFAFINCVACRPLIGSSLIQQIPPALTDMNTSFTAGEFSLVDFVSFHDDVYGIPWDHYLNNASIPVWWTQTRIQLRDFIRNTLQKPIFLNLPLLDGSRSCPGYNVSQTGVPRSNPSFGCSSCYDFGTTNPNIGAIKAAYIQYVLDQIAFFNPIYLNFGIEINVYIQNCNAIPGRWQSLVSYTNDVYDAIKTRYPLLPIAPSFVLYPNTTEAGCAQSVYNTSCIQSHVRLIQNLKRDFFIISSFPYGIDQANRDIDYISWYQNIFPYLPNETFAIGETGYPTAPIVLNLGTTENPYCITYFNSSDQRATGYLNYILQLAVQKQMPFVTWWSMRDYTPTQVCVPVNNNNKWQIQVSCPCNNTGLSLNFCDIVAFLQAQLGIYGEFIAKIWNTMGFFTYDGSVSKTSLIAALDSWKQAQGPAYISTGQSVTTGSQLAVTTGSQNTITTGQSVTTGSQVSVTTGDEITMTTGEQKESSASLLSVSLFLLFYFLV